MPRANIAELFELMDAESLRPVARIMGASSASARLLETYDAAVAEGQSPVIASIDGAFVVFHHQPEEAEAGRIAVVRGKGSLVVVPQDMLAEAKP